MTCPIGVVRLNGGVDSVTCSGLLCLAEFGGLAVVLILAVCFPRISCRLIPVNITARLVYCCTSKKKIQFKKNRNENWEGGTCLLPILLAIFVLHSLALFADPFSAKFFLYFK